MFQALTVITPLITAPYVARTLQPEGVGVFSYVNSIVSYFVLLANLGTVTYAQREISYIQEDVDKRSIAFWNVFFLRFITSVVTFILYLIFSFFSRFRFLFLILGLNIVSVIFDVSWFYQGMENFGTIMRKNIIIRILTVLSIFAFVHREEDLPIYCLVLGMGTFLGYMAQWVQLRSLVNKPDWSRIHPFSDIKTVLSLFVPTIAIQLYTILDKTMIGLFSGVGAENGYYEEAMKFARLTQTLVISLSTVMLPRIGSCYAQGKKEEIRKYIYQSFQYVWAVAIPLSFGLIGISDNLVPWFLGENFEKVSALLKILSLLLIIIGINTITGNEYLIPTNRQNEYTKTVMLGASVNISLNLLLIPHLFSIGAALASVVAETSIAGYQLFITRKELSFKNIIQCSKKYLCAGTIMLLILRIENHCFDASMVHTMIMILTGGATYLVILLVLRDRFIIDNLKVGMNIFRNCRSSNCKKHV